MKKSLATWTHPVYLGPEAVRLKSVAGGDQLVWCPAYDEFVSVAWYRGTALYGLSIDDSATVLDSCDPMSPDTDCGSDGVPLEIQGIADSEARVAARLAWRSQEPTTWRNVYVYRDGVVLAQWFPAWIELSTLRSWASSVYTKEAGIYTVELLLSEENPALTRIINRRKL